jgi:hypothetical protein
VTIAPRDTLPIASNLETFSSVVIIELYDENGENIQPAGSVEICLPFDQSLVSIDELCLAFINANGDWECQDLDLTAEGDQACGETDHFTEFALLKTKDVNPDPSVSSTPAPSASRTPLNMDYTYSVNTFSYFTLSYPEYSTFSTFDDFFSYTAVQTNSFSPDSSSDSSSGSILLGSILALCVSVLMVLAC